jgi:hypothetical protein
VPAVVASLAAFATSMALPTLAAAQGCAMCKTSLEGSNDPLVGAFNVSVLFMMAMPYAVVGTIGGYIFYTARRGSAAEPSPEPREPTSEPEA